MVEALRSVMGFLVGGGRKGVEGLGLRVFMRRRRVLSILEHGEAGENFLVGAGVELRPEFLFGRSVVAGWDAEI